MNRRLIASALLAMLFVLAGVTTRLSGQTTFYWSGVTSTGWQGDVSPAFDGTEDFYLGKAINQRVTLSGSPAVNSIYATSGDSYLIRSQCDNSLTLTINTGIFGTASSSGRLVFDSPLTLTGNSTTGNLTMDSGNSQIIVEGHIKDGGMPTNLTLTTSSAGVFGSFIFNDTGCGNDYTGNTTITSFDAATPVVVAFWNSSPFGSGTLSFGATPGAHGAAQLTAHGYGQTVSNDVVINTSDSINLKSWDDTLKFTTCGNTVTLNADATLVAQRGQQGFPDENNFGIYPLPGPFTRNAIMMGGDIVDGTGSHSLTVNGGGVLMLEGSNSYTGGTIVGSSGGATGSLVFTNTGAIPATGNITLYQSGYAGIADTSSGNFAAFLLKIVDQANLGAVGVDTLPYNGTNILSDDIDLSGFTHPIRLGTATSAILTGNITPQGANYLFGNGGGTLYVQSDLSGGRAVSMNNNSAVPLTLYLQGGNNTYSGGTTVNNGFVIFDSDGALPASGMLTASGSGDSYIGYTDQAYISAATFLASFNKPATNGIIGFDTNATTLWQNGPALVTDNINLSTFNNGVYLGTATGVILSGNLTPTADNILRLTAAQGSTLEVDSLLSGTMALSLGTTSPSDVYSNGTVFLNHANTYSGGTTINSTAGGLTLDVGDNNALGTGTLTLANSVIAGLEAYNFGIVLPNPITLNPGSQLFITGWNDLQLSGNISGSGSITAVNPEEDPDLTLSGNNSAFTGDISLYNSYLYLDNNNAAGHGTIRFLNSNTGLEFTSNALSPTIYGLKDENQEGYVDLYDSLDNPVALTINTSNAVNDHDFGGEIYDNGDGGSLTITSNASSDPLYLHGHNDYSGGTFIGTGPTDKAALAIGTDDALGSGSVTLNTSVSGAFALNRGVTFTNDFVYSGGTLQGFGTFSPMSVNGDSSPTRTVVFDAGKGVVGGIYGLGSHNLPGQLTITTGVDFANGGAMLWMLQDANTPSGYSVLNVNGNNLNISATTGQFKIFLASLDSNGAAGWGSLTNGNSYHINIATTSGGSVTNFDPTAFTIDTSLFQNTFIVSPFLTTDGNNLILNFTAVPEPSTYALLGLGLTSVLIPVLRRRRKV